MQKFKSFLIFSIFCLIFISCEQPNQNSEKKQNNFDYNQDISFEGFNLLSEYHVDKYNNACISSKDDLKIEFDLEDLNIDNYSFEYINNNEYLYEEDIIVEQSELDSKKILMNISKQVLVSLDTDYNTENKYVNRNYISGKLVIKDTSSEILKEIELNNIVVNSCPSDLLDVQIQKSNNKYVICCYAPIINGVNDIHTLSLVYDDENIKDYLFFGNYNFVDKKTSIKFEQPSDLKTLEGVNSTFKNLVPDGYITLFIDTGISVQKSEPEVILYLKDDYFLCGEQNETEYVKKNKIRYETPELFIIDMNGKKYPISSDSFIEIKDNNSFYIGTDYFSNGIVYYYDENNVKKSKPIEDEVVEYTIYNVYHFIITSTDTYFEYFTNKKSYSTNYIFDITASVYSEKGNSCSNKKEYSKVRIAKPIYYNDKPLDFVDYGKNSIETPYSYEIISGRHDCSLQAYYKIPFWSFKIDGDIPNITLTNFEIKEGELLISSTYPDKKASIALFNFDDSEADSKNSNKQYYRSNNVYLKDIDVDRLDTGNHSVVLMGNTNAYIEYYNEILSFNPNEDVPWKDYIGKKNYPVQIQDFTGTLIIKPVFSYDNAEYDYRERVIIPLKEVSFENQYLGVYPNKHADYVIQKDNPEIKGSVITIVPDNINKLNGGAEEWVISGSGYLVLGSWVK